MSLYGNVSEDTLAEMRRSLLDQYAGSPNPAFGGEGSLRRDYTTSLGLVNYDLQKPAKNIRPFVFVLLNMTPRKPGMGGLFTIWRSITGINTGMLEGTVPEADRYGTITTTEQNVQANYATLGLEDFVSYEAQAAGEGFEDVRARMALNLLYATKEIEEFATLGGDAGLALGTPVMNALSTATTGGTIGAGQAIYGSVVALTMAGFRAATVAGGVPTTVSLTSPVGEAISYNGGSSAAAAPVNITTGTGTSTNTVSASCTPVVGAVGYAWYFGTSVSHQYLTGITTLNSFVLKAAPPTAGQDATTLTVDHSKNVYTFDGLFTQCCEFSSGANVTSLATGTPGTGTVLTSDGSGGINEINTILKNQWDANRTSPDFVLVNSQELNSIDKIIVNNGGAPLFRFMVDNGGMRPGDPLTGATMVGNYLNRFTPEGGKLIKMVLHPNMPAGSMLFLTSQIPGGYFPGANLGMLWEHHVRRDFYQLEYPPRTRKYETGVYVEETLAHYFPATMAVLNNVAAS